MATERPLPCQHCGDAWIDEEDTEKGIRYRIVCTCGNTEKKLNLWYSVKAALVRDWNKIALDW